MPLAKLLPMKRSSSSSEAKNRLRQILIEKSYLRDGPYTLSSGEKSDVFFDVKMTSLDPEGATLAADLILDKLVNSGATAVGGLAMGACPIVSAVCVRSYERGMPLASFYVRKEEKQHGTKKKIEGANLTAKDKVAILDDVATKGGSMIDAISPVKELGCAITKVIVVVDRQQGAKERLAGAGYNLESIFTRSDLE